jgi:SPP1 gp7 family putative phage head morphogenesis protein
MGRLADLHKRRALYRRLRVPPGVEQRYAHALTGVMRAMHTEAMHWLEPKLGQVLTHQDANSSLPGEWMAHVDGLVRQLAPKVVHPFTKLATAVAKSNAQALGSLGIDIRGQLGPVVAAAQEWSQSLLVNAGRDYASQVADVMNDPDNWGLRHEELAKLIYERADVSESHAELIGRDQSSKVNSAINMSRQQAVGITSYTWSGSLDERERETHLQNEGLEFDWIAPPVETGNPGDDVQCLPGDTQIEFAHGVRKGFRRWYSGQLATVVTSSGKTLRATPNHPVLTPDGWIAIGSLHHGDHVIEVAEKLGNAIEEDQHDRVPTIREVLASIQEAGITEAAHLRPADFHGDGTEGDVDVVHADGSLRVDVLTGGTKRIGQFPFAMTDAPGAGERALLECLSRPFAAARRFMRALSQRLSVLRARALHPQEVGLGAVAKPHASCTKSTLDDDALETESARHRKHALSNGMSNEQSVDIHGDDGASLSLSPVGPYADSAKFLAQVVGRDADDRGHFLQGLPAIQQVSRVVRVDVDAFHGLVFNLEVADGWYVAHGIVTRNCRCVAIPVIPDLDGDDDDS